MRTLISIVARDAGGTLRVVADRKVIEHSGDHGEIEAACVERKDAGDDMVLILFADDSVARHWTRPDGAASEPDAGADVLGEVTEERPRRRAKAKAKKKSKR